MNGVENFKKQTLQICGAWQPLATTKNNNSTNIDQAQPKNIFVKINK